MNDLVKRLRDKNCCDASHCNCDEAADRIEALEAKNRLLEQSQAAHALAGLGVDVVAAYNSGLAALKAGCKEERLRAEKAETRIEALEAALREMLEIVATHRVYVGNSPAGELACEWTMDAIKEIHAKMEEVLARATLGENKDDAR